MFAVNGILFNHESPRRGETFVTRKITRAVARIKAGLQDKLYLGNLDAERDWGYAPEYVEAMWRMLQADEPDDYVLATGETHSVREFLEAAFAHVGLDWEKHVRFDERYLRPAEVDALLGDPARPSEQLGWEPTVDASSELVRIMVDADVEALEDQLAGRGVASVRAPCSAERGLLDGQGASSSPAAPASSAARSRAMLERARRRGRACRARAEHDLRDPAPHARGASSGAEVVIHLAANVGGIGFNRRNPAPLVYDNLMMGAQRLRAVAAAGVGEARRRLLGLRLPEVHAVPFSEDDLWNGYPEESNAPYGLAKKMLLVLSDAYRRQYGFDSCVPDRGQPVRARRQLRPRGLARDRGDDPQVRRGARARRRARSCSGARASPTREFLYVDDAARALLLAAERCDSSEPVNIGTGIETRIRDLAETIERLVGYEGETVWDTVRPDGQPKRFLDVVAGARADGLRGRGPLRGGPAAHDRELPRAGRERGGVTCHGR